MPTARNTWKHFERTVARLFGAERNPLSGSNSKHTGSDTLHEDLYIECKYRAALPIWDLFVDTSKKAKKEGKVPVVAIKKKGQDGILLVLRPEDLKEVCNHIKDIDKNDTGSENSGG